jgi:hypothetical protein
MSHVDDLEGEEQLNIQGHGIIDLKSSLLHLLFECCIRKYSVII